MQSSSRHHLIANRSIPCAHLPWGKNRSRSQRQTGWGEGGGGWYYKKLFPRLSRCLAVVYETLRLYPTVLALLSITSGHTQAFQVGNKTFHIPVGVTFTANIRAMHTHPQYWPDANE